MTSTAWWAAQVAAEPLDAFSVGSLASLKQVGGDRHVFRPLESTVAAGEAQTAVLQPAAAKVVLHLAHHEARQPARLLGLLEQARPVLLDTGKVTYLIHGPFGSTKDFVTRL